MFFALEQLSNLFHWSTLVFLLAESSTEATEATEAKATVESEAEVTVETKAKATVETKPTVEAAKGLCLGCC